MRIPHVSMPDAMTGRIVEVLALLRDEVGSMTGFRSSPRSEDMKVRP